MDKGHIIGDKYRIDKPIGTGGMGDVYLGYDVADEMAVAIKALKHDLTKHSPELIVRFEREGQVLRQLNHPNIVKMLGSMRDEGQHFIIMEYVGGGSVADLLVREKQIDAKRVMEIALDLSDALTRAHRLGVLHRDLKPANILLAEDGTPRLTDFGIAQVSGTKNLTETGAMVGTLSYLSPEALDGQAVDNRSDIWSFGITLYQMLTGRLPFDETSLSAVIASILTKPLPDITSFRDDIPPGLTVLLYRMLDKDPQLRINSVRLVGAELEAILEGSTAYTPSGQIEVSTDSSAIIYQSPEHVLHNLPAQTTPFVGRVKRLKDLIEQLEDSNIRLLTVVGLGGIGKTRLALEAALTQLSRFVHGVYFVSLAPINDSERIIPAIAKAAGFTFFGSDDVKVQLLNYLREKNMLLVLDYFDHLISAAKIVTEILEAAPGVQIMVTSRERLRLRGEWVCELDRMELGDWSSPAELENYESVQLFLEGARRAQSDLELDEEIAPMVERLIQLVQGLPLGIELAASWLETLPLDEIINEIEDSYDFLETDLRDIPEQHRSMRAVFESSWHLLQDEERASFRCLSVFRGGFDRDAAKAVAGASLRTLTNMVNKSLLRTLSSGRYEINELLREYAAQHLAEEPEREAITRGAHSDYYMGILQHSELEWLGPDPTSNIEEIAVNIENIRAAIDWAIQHREAEKLSGALPTLDTFYETRSLHQQGLEIYEQVIDTFRDDPESRFVYAQAIIRQGGALVRLSQHQEANKLLEEGLEIARQFNSMKEELLALNWITYDAMIVGNFEHSITNGRRALELAQAEQDEMAIVSMMANLAYAYFLSGNNIEAKPLMEDALERSKKLKLPTGIAYNSNNLGEVLQAMGNYEKARQLFKEGYRIFEEIGYRRGMAFTLNNLAGLDVIEDNYDRAKHEYAQAHEIYKELGDFIGLGHSLSALGNEGLRHARYDDARNYYQQSLEIRRKAGSRPGEADSLIDLSDVALIMGDLDQSEQHLKESLEIRRSIGEQRGIAGALTNLGMVAIAKKEADTARKSFEESRTISQEIGDDWSQRFSRANLCLVAVELGEFERAQEDLDAFLNEIDDNMARSFGLAMQGHTAYGLGDNEAARGHFIEALRISTQAGNLMLMLYILNGYAQLVADNHSAEEIVRLLHIAANHPTYATYFRYKNEVTLAGFQEQISPEAAQDTKEFAHLQSIEETVKGILSGTLYGG